MVASTGESLRVDVVARGWRRFSAGLMLFLLAYAVAVFVVEGLPWYTRMTPLLLLLGHLPIAFQWFAYTELTDEGLELATPFRRRHVPWEQVQEIELGGRRKRTPRFLLTDGSALKSLALGGVARKADADPKLRERLRQAAETHGFVLRLQ